LVLVVSKCFKIKEQSVQLLFKTLKNQWFTSMVIWLFHIFLRITINTPKLRKVWESIGKWVYTWVDNQLVSVPPGSKNHHPTLVTINSPQFREGLGEQTGSPVRSCNLEEGKPHAGNWMTDASGKCWTKAALKSWPMNEWIEAFRVSTVQGSRKSAKRETQETLVTTYKHLRR
jgi:hypothetical protein